MYIFLAGKIFLATPLLMSLILYLSEEGVSNHFQKLLSNFKEANKKLIIVLDSEKLLKDLEKH